MKKIILLSLLSIFISTSVFADIEFFKSKSKNNRKCSFEKGGISIGYSGLIQNLGNMSLPSDAEFLSQQGKSINITIHFLQYTHYILPKMGISTGLEMEINNFRFEHNMIPVKDLASGMTVADDSFTERGITLKKSKLVTTYLNIPLVAKFHFSNNLDKFYIYGGFVGGWRIQTHTKIRANSDALKGKYKNHSNLNTRAFHVGYTAGIGYDHFGIYTKYYPQSIFRPGKGPSVQQANIGISMIF